MQGVSIPPKSLLAAFDRKFSRKKSAKRTSTEQGSTLEPTRALRCGAGYFPLQPALPLGEACRLHLVAAQGPGGHSGYSSLLRILAANRRF